MGKIISFNSWNEFFKAPFGALKINEGANIKVKVNEKCVNNIQLIVLREYKNLSSEEIRRINLTQVNEDLYEGVLESLPGKGLYYYYFEVNININGNEKTLFYGKTHNNGEVCEYSYGNLNKYQLTVYEEYETPQWLKEGILYQIFVDRFNNGNRNGKINSPKKNSFVYANWEDDPMYIKDSEGDIVRWDFYGGNLKGIISKLGYLKKLGVSIIYLNPIFEARSNHKYDTGNYKKIDEMYGDEEILKELIEKAADKDISIILDGVFSHTGADSIYFNKFNNYNSEGAYQSPESPYRSWYNFDNSKDGYESWWGVKDLPNVNELDEAYRDYIIKDEDSVLNKWTNMGIKGWRLDVADELPSQFISEFKENLKKADNDSILVGEVWEDASNKVSYGERRQYLLGDQLDSVMGYPFRKSILSFLKGEIPSYELNDIYMTIKENYPPEAFKSNLNLLGSHDVNRLKTELNGDKELVKLAVITQMTFEGVPYIYYGDEAGIEGKSDPDNRRAYPWKNEDNDMVDFYRNSIQTRKRIKTLSKGETRFIYTMNNDVFAFERCLNNDDDKNENCLIIINRSNKDQSITLDLDCNILDEIGIKYSPGDYGQTLEEDNKEFDIHMMPKSYMIFKMKDKSLELTESV